MHTAFDRGHLARVLLFVCSREIVSTVYTASRLCASCAVRLGHVLGSTSARAVHVLAWPPGCVLPAFETVIYTPNSDAIRV
jgi:hypothetical protein